MKKFRFKFKICYVKGTMPLSQRLTLVLQGLGSILDGIIMFISAGKLASNFALTFAKLRAWMYIQSLKDK